MTRWGAAPVPAALRLIALRWCVTVVGMMRLALVLVWRIGRLLLLMVQTVVLWKGGKIAANIRALSLSLPGRTRRSYKI